MLDSISTKDLRLNMKAVKKNLLNGVSLVWIDHSQPLAKIVPIEQSTQQQAGNWLEDMKKARFRAPGKKQRNAVDIIRKERS